MRTAEESRSATRLFGSVAADPTVILASAGLAASGIAAVLLAVHREPLAVDTAIQQTLLVWGTDVSSPAALVLAELGSGAVLFPLLIVLALVKRTWAVAVLPVVLALGQVCEVVLLSVLPRTAPDLYTWSGLSSGRTVTAVLGWGLVCLALGGSARRSVAVGVMVGSVVAATRVVLDLHWTSDVVVALVFATSALVLFSTTVWDRLPRTAISGRATLRWLCSSRWTWAFTGAAAGVAVLPNLLQPASSRLGDLAVYIGTARVVGEGGDLYGFRTADGLPFTYPPFAALIAEPLARIPLPVVQLMWTAATLVAAVCVAAVAMRPVVDRIGLPVTSGLLILSWPVRSHVHFGQVGLFLVLLVAADLLHRHRHRGWGVGLASAIKLTPTLFILWLGVVGSWSRLRASLAWATAATVLGLVLLWPSSPSWVSNALWDSTRFGPNDIPGNQSVRGMLLRALDDDLLAERIWILLAMVLLVVGLLGARRLELAGNRLGAVGVVAATSVAVSPISWQHHLVWLTLPIAALVAAERHKIAIAWAAVLMLPFTSVGTMIHVPVVGAQVTDTYGLTAVAATIALPQLLRQRSPILAQSPSLPLVT
jgi:alpha-1,2-mannosyltransferase